ncbi:MAG: AAA family ATPase, partial [Oscillospiraceae bacterium]|nr:AAA family ATPase [Oscillospiraceae bacterium]
MKKLPLGIQSFREIASGGYIYVDKTEYIYNLIGEAKYYFISRPRRFGKSLLLDTIGEVFSGDRELFKGLWIYGSDYEFKKHPVIRLDMSNISNSSPGVLEDSLYDDLSIKMEDEGIEITDRNPANVFKRLILSLYKKYNQRVVVLIDEYDKPILDHLSDAEAAEANRQVLRGFYGILKSMDPYLRFTMITGVTKFTKTSIFSGLNNLFDITMSRKYANICGIPVECLGEYFGEHIANLSSSNDFMETDDIHGKILDWYDGYSWDGKSRLLNPFSLLNFFLQKRLGSYWYASGTPWFLIDIIKKKPASFVTLKNLEIGEWMLDAFDILKIEPEPLMFQTGYLTVKEVVLTDGAPTY